MLSTSWPLRANLAGRGGWRCVDLRPGERPRGSREAGPSLIHYDRHVRRREVWAVRQPWVVDELPDEKEGRLPEVPEAVRRDLVPPSRPEGVAGVGHRRIVERRMQALEGVVSPRRQVLAPEHEGVALALPACRGGHSEGAVGEHGQVHVLGLIW